MKVRTSPFQRGLLALQDAPTSARFARRALVGLPFLGWVANAEAAGDAICRRADTSEYVTKNKCNTLACGGREGCICVQTLGHKPRCVMGFDPDNPNDCPKHNECNKRRTCGKGMLCAKVQGCCGTQRRRCLKRCLTA